MHESPLVFEIPLLLAKEFNFGNWVITTIVGGILGAVVGVLAWLVRRASGGDSSTTGYGQYRGARKRKIKRPDRGRRTGDDDEEDDLEKSPSAKSWTPIVVVSLIAGGGLFLLLIVGCVALALFWHPGDSHAQSSSGRNHPGERVSAPSDQSSSSSPDQPSSSRPDRTSSSQPERPPGPVAPVAARFEKSEVPLPGAVTDVAVGGTGKYLVLHVAAKERMVVFDAWQGKVLHELPLPAGQVYVVAGSGHAVVVAPTAGTIELCNLANGTKEGTTRAAQLTEDEVQAICMGSGSTGPIFVSQRKKKRTLAIDPQSGAAVELHWKHWAPNSSGGPAGMSCTQDGSIVIGWGGSWVGMETITMRQGQQVANSDKYEFFGDFALPSADGTRLFTPQARVNLLDSTAKKNDLLKTAYQVPARDAGYFVALYSGRWKDEAARKDTPICQLVFMREDEETMFTLEDGEWQNPTGLPWEKCVHYYPNIKRLVSLDKERLVLRRFQ